MLAKCVSVIGDLITQELIGLKRADDADLYPGKLQHRGPFRFAILVDFFGRVMLMNEGNISVDYVVSQADFPECDPCGIAIGLKHSYQATEVCGVVNVRRTAAFGA